MFSFVQISIKNTKNSSLSQIFFAFSDKISKNYAKEDSIQDYFKVASLYLDIDIHVIRFPMGLICC